MLILTVKLYLGVFCVSVYVHFEENIFLNVFTHSVFFFLSTPSASNEKTPRQFVFAAATVPITGDKTVLNWFQKKEHALFGHTLFVSTEGIVVSSAKGK